MAKQTNPKLIFESHPVPERGRTRWISDIRFLIDTNARRFFLSHFGEAGDVLHSRIKGIRINREGSVEVLKGRDWTAFDRTSQIIYSVRRSK